MSPLIAKRYKPSKRRLTQQSPTYGIWASSRCVLINQALRDAAQGVTLAEVVRQTIRQELKSQPAR